MNGLMVNGRVKVAGVTFYTRNGKTIVRSAHSNQPKRRTRAQFDVRQRMRHTVDLWKLLKWADPVFTNGKNPYGGFATLAKQLPVVYMPSRGAMAEATFVMPGMPVCAGPLPTINQRLADVDGRPALVTDLVANDLKACPRLRLFTLTQAIEIGRPTMRPTVRDVALEELCEVDGHYALVGDEFADTMKGWALVRFDADKSADGTVRCSTQTVVTRCTYYKAYTTEEAFEKAVETFGGLTE